MKKTYLTLLLLSSYSFGAQSAIDMPSSVPLEVFELKENQRAIGIINFNVGLELEDSYYKDKIGDIEYKTNGLIYTMPKKGSDTFIGKMFELSYTAGVIDSSIKESNFIDNGITYNNTFDKSGFYVGIRPSYNKSLYHSDNVDVKSSTTFHSMFYSISGSFSVKRVDTSFSYTYDEENYGVAFKPTTVIQGTYYPTQNLGLTLFGGLSAFAVLDWAFYSGGESTAYYLDEDNELALETGEFSTVVGYDITYKYKDSMFNLSTAFTQKKDDDSSETILKYVYEF